MAAKETVGFVSPRSLMFLRRQARRELLVTKVPIVFSFRLMIPFERKGVLQNVSTPILHTLCRHSNWF